MGIEMTDIKKKKFKIDLSTPVPEEFIDDAPLAEGFASGKTASWSLWMIFIAVLILGAAFVWAYYDLHSKLQAVDTTGATEITGLAAEFNEQLEALETQIADHNAALQSDLAGLEKQVETTGTAISEIRTAKADQDELKTVGNRVTAATAAIDALKNDIAGIQKLVDQVPARMEQTIVRIDGIESAVEDNRMQVDLLADRFVDKDLLNEVLTVEREFTQRNMAHQAETLYSDIAALQKTVSELQGRIDVLTQSLAEVQEKSMAPTAPEAPPATVDGIIEQEIR
jgi:chromosome segregation ATPase